MRVRCVRYGTLLWMHLKAHGVLYILIASLCMNVAYRQRLRAMEARRVSAPQPGDVLQPQRVETRRGRIVDLVGGASGVPTIVYYFSPSCAWCERNWSSVSVLARETSSQYRFIALAEAPDVGKTIEKHNLAFDVVGGLKVPDRRALGFTGTPQTIVVSREGRVLRAWTGAYGDRIRAEIEEYFGVVLPGT